MYIKEPEFVYAHSVGIEFWIYEDDFGNIHFVQEKNIGIKEITDKDNLIKADVVFFDFKGNPKLLIEVIATHKVDSEKLIKLKRIGIDTVQVKIPKSSPEDIENCFKRTDSTKWLYNNERENTTYISTSRENTERIPQFDEFEREKLKFEKSFSCRKAEISNLIRELRKSLESEQYRRVAEGLRRERARIDADTESERTELDRVRKQYEDAARESTKAKKDELTSREQGLRSEEREFEKRRGKLEGRYYLEKRELEENREQLEERYYIKKRELRGATDNITKIINAISSSLEGIEKRRKETATEFEQASGEIGTEAEQIKEEGTKLDTEFEESIQGLSTRIREMPEEFRREEVEFREKLGRRKEEFTENMERRKAQFREKLEREKIEFIEERERFETQIRNEFEQDRIKSIKAIENRNTSEVSRVRRKIRGILDEGQVLDDVTERRSCFKRLGIVKEAFDKNAHKNWL